MHPTSLPNPPKWEPKVDAKIYAKIERRTIDENRALERSAAAKVAPGRPQGVHSGGRGSQGRPRVRDIEEKEGTKDRW